LALNFTRCKGTSPREVSLNSARICDGLVITVDFPAPISGLTVYRVDDLCLTNDSSAMT